jgi:hypothetical protein
MGDELWSCNVTLVQTYITHPLLVPAFYTIVPIIFYIIVFSTGTSFDALREMGNTFLLT